MILGISEAPQNISFAAMAERQQELNRAILEDPAVESLSSFIGIDGTNTTLNSGRIQINLKPLEERQHRRERRHSPVAAASWPKVDGITLFMQPVQDLTVETRVSRTQYQYSLEDSERQGAERMGAAVRRASCKRCRELRDVASDQQNEGLQARVVIDRDTASRLGITPQMIDDALYDAFGQRQISIMFTQLNQYRVVLEVKPDFRNEPRDLSDDLRPAADGRHGAARARSRAIEETTTPAGDQPSGAVSGRDGLVQSRARRLAGRGGRGDRRGQARTRSAAQHLRPASRARPRRFRRR